MSTKIAWILIQGVVSLTNSLIQTFYTGLFILNTIPLWATLLFRNLRQRWRVYFNIILLEFLMCSISIRLCYRNISLSLWWVPTWCLSWCLDQLPCFSNLRSPWGCILQPSCSIHPSSSPPWPRHHPTVCYPTLGRQRLVIRQHHPRSNPTVWCHRPRSPVILLVVRHRLPLRRVRDHYASGVPHRRRVAPTPLRAAEERRQPSRSTPSCQRTSAHRHHPPIRVARGRATAATEVRRRRRIPTTSSLRSRARLQRFGTRPVFRQPTSGVPMMWERTQGNSTSMIIVIPNWHQRPLQRASAVMENIWSRMRLILGGTPIPIPVRNRICIFLKTFRVVMMFSPQMCHFPCL